jgi:methyltransferase-like protein
MANSEVANLREKIALEYQAAKQVFTNFTPTARHEFITKRQENIAAYFEDLKQHMSPDEAILLIIQVDNEIHGFSASGGSV